MPEITWLFKIAVYIKIEPYA